MSEEKRFGDIGSKPDNTLPEPDPRPIFPPDANPEPEHKWQGVGGGIGDRDRPDLKPERGERPLGDVVKTKAIVERREGEDPEEVLAKATEILNEYGGLQGNIPVGSDYWNLMNHYRSLVAPKF